MGGGVSKVKIRGREIDQIDIDAPCRLVVEVETVDGGTTTFQGEGILIVSKFEKDGAAYGQAKKVIS